MIQTEKTKSILTKELETLTDMQLHDLFTFFYKLNSQHGNIITTEKFDEFLRSFDYNPFRTNFDPPFKKQLIQNLIIYTDDHMSLITAVMLLKQQFSIDEIIDNYYSNVDVFESNLTDLHSRISQGIREAKRNGTQIGLTKGITLTTKKSIDCKAIIKKHAKDFGGTLDDPDVMKLCGCSRNSYYKYKREIKENNN